MKKVKKLMYVTFQFKPSKYVETVMGVKTRKYAIECETLDEAHEIMSDVNSLDGVSYIRLNKCHRLPKGTIIAKLGDAF